MTDHIDIFCHTFQRSVAIVGNSQGQFSRRDGDAIEAHDVVVRMNRGLVKNPEVQGTRTDILSLSLVLSPDEIKAFNPEYIMWATPKREKMPEDLDLFVHPDEYWTLLHNNVGARPSTGAITLNYFSNHLCCSSIDVYGFDSFKTGTFYTGQRRTGPHDPEKERAFIKGLENQGKIKVFGHDLCV